MKAVKKKISKPLLLENVAYYMRPEHSEMDDGTFLKRAVEENDCGILLDVANLFGNAKNLGIDPKKFIDELPAERIIQIHLAGGRMLQNVLVDTHDKAIWRETWELLQYVIQKTDLKAISIERDGGYDEHTSEEILNELKYSKKLLGMRINV